MGKQEEPELKYFKITSLGESTFEWAPSKASILQDLQRAGALEKDTIIEEVTPAQAVEEIQQKLSPQAPIRQDPAPQTKAEPKFFTLPGGQKIKDDNGVLYSLEWRDYTRRQVLERMGCEDIKFPDDCDTLPVLDWVKLEQEEGKEDASETDSNV